MYNNILINKSKTQFKHQQVNDEFKLSTWNPFEWIDEIFLNNETVLIELLARFLSIKSNILSFHCETYCLSISM